MTKLARFGDCFGPIILYIFFERIQLTLKRTFEQLENMSVKMMSRKETDRERNKQRQTEINRDSKITDKHRQKKTERDRQRQTRTKSGSDTQ